MIIAAYAKKHIRVSLLVITRVTSLNDTLPDLLAMVKPEAEILITDATDNMPPKPFFAKGVTMTDGIIVSKADELLNIINEGVSTIMNASLTCSTGLS